MRIRVMRTEDLESIVRKEFSNHIPGNLHAYLATFNMICRKHRLAVVQADAGQYPELIATTEITVDA